MRHALVCRLVGKTETDLVVEVRQLRPDASLPLPFDRPALAGLLVEKASTPVGPDDLEQVTLETVSDLLGPQLAATYRLTLAVGARAMLQRFEIDSRWNAAAVVAHRSTTPAELSLNEFMKAKASLKVDARRPQGTVPERIDRLRRLLVAPPHANDRNHDAELRPTHILPMLSDYGTTAAVAVEEVCAVLFEDAAAPLTLAHLQNPLGIGPLALAFGALVPHTLSKLDPEQPHRLYHFVQNALTAFGWFGPIARPFVETMLRQYEPPVARQQLALAFARWRVLEDDAQRLALIRLWDAERKKDASWCELTNLLGSMLFDGPLAQLPTVMDAVRHDLVAKGEVGSLAWAEEKASKRLERMVPKKKAAKKAKTR